MEKGLGALYTLTLTSHRLRGVAEYHLYRLGVEEYKALPLAWAAHTGCAVTFLKALGYGGADPNTEFKFFYSSPFWMSFK